MPDDAFISLEEAAERSGQSTAHLRTWCATGKLHCVPRGREWLVPVSELPAIARAAREHATAVEDKRVTAIAVPAASGVPPDLADQVASRLGLSAGNVSLTPLALDGVDYVVAVWRGAMTGTGGLPALAELAEELDGELLDGEVEAET